MSSVAIITARGGSKRIPKKNIKEFMGKPMIAYAIKAALDSCVFDEVMVSTDDEEIADEARRFGASVPFMRSTETANDFSTTAEVISEVISRYEMQGTHFDVACCIYPCVPFLSADLLRESQQLFMKTGADTLMPAVRYSFPIQRALRMTSSGFVAFREPENAVRRTQDLEPMFHDAGMFYFLKVKSFLDQRAIVMKNTTIKEVDEAVAQDIDSQQDWLNAEIKYRILMQSKEV